MKTFQWLNNVCSLLKRHSLRNIIKYSEKSIHNGSLKELGIKGYVRNLPNGTVEVVAEADEENLKRFFDEIKDGPPLAKVTDVRYEFLDKEGGFKDFEIRY